MSGVRITSHDKRNLVIESAAFGLGYTAVLIWIGSALVASFTDKEASPYWPVIPHLRTDTSGVGAFAIAIVSLIVSRYLQLKRTNGMQVKPVARSPRVLAVQAAAETAAILATAIVIYLSFNAFTHPITLRLQLTHLWPWPSEGTVRVIALGICLVAVATRRYLRATAGQAIPVSQEAGQAAGQEAGRAPAPAVTSALSETSAVAGTSDISA